MDYVFDKKAHSILEFYSTLYKGLSTIKCIVKSKRNNELSPTFIERIMLVVTEVNGCEICAYAHIKIALEQGTSNEEIQKPLSGETEHINTDETPCYLF